MGMFSSEKSGTDMLIEKLLSTPAIAEAMEGFKSLADEVKSRQERIESQLTRIENLCVEIRSHQLGVEIPESLEQSKPEHELLLK